MTDVINRPAIPDPEEAKAKHKDEYDVLNAYVKTINEQVAPIKKKMKEYADESEKFRVLATEQAKLLSEARGGDHWFKVKKRIGTLARLMGGM